MWGPQSSTDECPSPRRWRSWRPCAPAELNGDTCQSVLYTGALYWGRVTRGIALHIGRGYARATAPARPAGGLFGETTSAAGAGAGAATRAVLEAATGAATGTPAGAPAGAPAASSSPARRTRGRCQPLSKHRQPFSRRRQPLHKHKQPFSQRKHRQPFSKRKRYLRAEHVAGLRLLALLQRPKRRAAPLEDRSMTGYHSVRGRQHSE